MRIKQIKSYNRVIQPPPDKSIMQRAVIFSLLADGIIQNPSFCGDALSAIECVKELSIQVELKNGELVLKNTTNSVKSLQNSGITSVDSVKKGEINVPADLNNDNLKALADLNKTEPKTLDCGNSATAARLLLGMAAGLGKNVIITGDKSLQNRSMRQTVEILTLFGANTESSSGRLPLRNIPATLKTATVEISKPSAQVKSAAILAALFARPCHKIPQLDNDKNSENSYDEVFNATDYQSVIYEKTPTRDHTERMLSSMGANITTEDGFFDRNGEAYSRKIIVESLYSEDKTASNQSKTPTNQSEVASKHLTTLNVRVPGDFSSAAFAIAMAAITKNGSVFIKNCGLNPLRTGMLSLLKNAGLNITTEVLGESCGETYGNIFVCQSDFCGFNIDGEVLPTLIDEVPILAVMACFARGTSVFKYLTPLKNKESDRIKGIFDGLKSMGANIAMSGDSLTIAGGFATPVKMKTQNKSDKSLVSIESDDHRIVMALAVAAAAMDGAYVKNPSAASVSYPDFFEDVIL